MFPNKGSIIANRPLRYGQGPPALRHAASLQEGPGSLDGEAVKPLCPAISLWPVWRARAMSKRTSRADLSRTHCKLWSCVRPNASNGCGRVVKRVDSIRHASDISPVGGKWVEERSALVMHIDTISPTGSCRAALSNSMKSMCTSAPKVCSTASGQDNSVNLCVERRGGDFECLPISHPAHPVAFGKCVERCCGLSAAILSENASSTSPLSPLIAPTILIGGSSLGGSSSSSKTMFSPHKSHNHET